jgi:pyruvate/2-oxoglutarate dehydrogenase complex dihydrolipoamide acyltransferase (E2) component
VRREPVVEEGAVVIRDVVTVTNTGDHRFGDGAIWNPMKKAF